MNKHTHPHLVNLFQSNEERKEKYWLCISLGVSPSWARAMRDWPLAKLERRFHLETKPFFELQTDGTMKLNSAGVV